VVVYEESLEILILHSHLRSAYVIGIVSTTNEHALLLVHSAILKSRTRSCMWPYASKFL
jgi:translation initiation factor 6 (eIF-6)